MYERLGTAVQSYADVVCVADSNKVTLRVNARFEEVASSKVWCRLQADEEKDAMGVTRTLYTLQAAETTTDPTGTTVWVDQVRFWGSSEAAVFPYAPYTVVDVQGALGSLVTVESVELSTPAEDEEASSNPVRLTGGEYDVEVDGVYDAIAARLEPTSALADRGEYAIKYLTTGAYPFVSTADLAGNVKNFVEYACELAGRRGDCTFLVDASPLCAKAQIFHEILETLVRSSAVTVPVTGENAYTFASAFYFDATYRTSLGYGSVRLPGSFAYLKSMAASTQNNPNWYAIAGVSRGLVSGVERVHHVASNLDADEFQPRDGVAINCVTNVTPYGYVIWGTRTLKDNRPDGDLTALSFLNVRQMTNDIKRVTYLACKSLMFEQNSDVLWIAFKDRIVPTLETMKTGSGVRDYDIVRLPSTRKGEVKARIVLVPIEPVEDWDITVELTDSVTTTAG